MLIDWRQQFNALVYFIRQVSMDSNLNRPTIETLQSLPRLGNTDLAKYPLYYFDRNRIRKLIEVPICNLDCKYACYTDVSMARKISEPECPCCRKRLGNKKNFIDIGLLQILRDNKIKIKNNQYLYLEYDHKTFEMKWLTKRETFVGRLGSGIADFFAEKFNSECAELTKKNLLPQVFHYVAMKDIVGEAFRGLTETLSSNIITWCRGNLASDVDFSGMILNLESNPNKVIFVDLVNAEGKVMSLDYKNTHIHFVPHLNIFVFLVLQSNKGTKQLSVKIADMATLMIGARKLVLRQTKKSIPGKTWYSSCYSYETKSIYIQGGLDNGQMTSTEFARLENLAWDLKTGTFDFKYNQFGKSEPLQVATLLPCYYRDDKRESILHIGGVQTTKAISIENFKFRGRINDYVLADGKPKIIMVKERSEFGAYPHCIQIPNLENYQITKKPKIEGEDRVLVNRLILVFGGTDDYIVDAANRRQQYGKAYLMDPQDLNRLQPIEKITLKTSSGQERKGFLSNELFPYLNDNSSAIMFEEVKSTEKGKPSTYKPKVRMLIPRRESRNYPSLCAFMIEAFIEEKLEDSFIVETEIARI